MGKNFRKEVFAACSNVDNSRQLLDSVKKDVSVLDDRLVLSILCVGSVGDYDSSDFVNLAVDASISDVSRQISVHVVLGDSKGLSHII